MRPLPPAMTLPLGDGESPTSFVSRTAMHLGRTAHDFCLDMGFRFQHVVDGHDETLQAVAALCRADPEKLRRNAFIREVQGFSLMGQTLIGDSLDLGQLSVCPHCLARDIQHGGGRREMLPHGRSVWRLSSIRTCLQHRSPLISVSTKSDRYNLHDFSLIVSRSLPHLDELVDQTIARSPSGLELYLANRLSGEGSSSPWLDQLPFYAAAKACEVIGSVVEFGLKVQFSDLSADDWYQAGATGFDVASQGESGVRDFLASLQVRFFASKQSWGAGQMFGRLYHWLAHESNDPAYEPLRSLMRNFVIETTPVGPGDEIFGREITKRRIHSVRSASRATGVPPRRLRNLLRAAGHIGEDAMKLTAERVLFDAEATHEFLEAVADSMHFNHARKYLNAPRRHDRMLVESGFIQPLTRSDDEGAPNYAIARKELDQFLERLLEEAQEGDSSSGVLAQIPVAARRKGCSPMRVVELILNRELKAYRLPAERGYLSVLVSTAELGQLLGDAEAELLPLKMAERTLGVHRTSVKGLVEHGFLPVQFVINRSNGRKQMVVVKQGLKEFMKRYVSLHVLAREKGIGFAGLKRTLADQGVMPAFDPEKVPTTFYERAAVAAFAPRGRSDPG